MPVRPEFATRVGNFIREYGHHYTPIGPEPTASIPVVKADATADSYHDLLDHFFNEYGHHFTPSETPHRVDPKAYIEAERLRRGIAPQPDGGQRPDPQPKADRSVSEYINNERARLGLPPVSVPQGQTGEPREVLNARLMAAQLANPAKDDSPTAMDYAAAIPGTAVAAYNNNMPRLFGEQATLGNMIGDKRIDSLADSFNRVLEHAVPYGARQAFDNGIDALGHVSAAMIPAVHVGLPRAAAFPSQMRGEPPVKSIASMDHDAMLNREAMAARDVWLKSQRGPGLEAQVEIRTPGQRQIAPSPPKGLREQSLSQSPKTDMGPQSNAMSVGNAETISNPPLPSSFQPPPPSSDLTPDLKRLQRADVSGAMSPPQIQNKPAQDGRIWTLRPDSFPDVRIPEESQIELPANAFDSAHTMPRYDPVTYSKGHSIVARPMIEHAIRQGQDVPTEAMLNNAFEAANLLPPKYGTRLNSANDFVSRSREAGRDNTKTADDLKWLMEMKAEDRKTIGYGPLPSIALPAAALSEADGEHHSGYQPRAKDGTFKGPPSEEWYGRGE